MTFKMILLFLLLEPIDSLMNCVRSMRMMDMVTNTSDIEVRPHRDRTRASTSDANVQTSLPIVNVMLPSRGGDQIAMPQINFIYIGV